MKIETKFNIGDTIIICGSGDIPEEWNVYDIKIKVEQSGISLLYLITYGIGRPCDNGGTKIGTCSEKDAYATRVDFVAARIKAILERADQEIACLQSLLPKENEKE